MHRLLSVMLCLVMVVGAVALAEDGGKEEEEKKWYDKIDFFGDFRLRYEGFDWGESQTGTHYDNGERQRMRYRLRLHLTTEITHNVKLGFEVRSGNPQNPISDNRSFDDGFDKDAISIAQAYARWDATPWFTVIGGKFWPAKLWTVSDEQYDHDLTVEGAMEMFTWKPGGIVETIDLNLWQYVMNESGDSVDSYMLGGQVVPVFNLGKKNSLAVGLGFESFQNPSDVAALYFKDKLVIDSGYVTNLVDPNTKQLISDFRIGTVFAEWSNKSFKRWPIKLKAYYWKNFGAEDALGSILPVETGLPALAVANGADNDTAYFARIEVGGYKQPGQVQVRFSYYYSEPDAIFFAYAQSDTRRSSNLNGIRTDVRIGMPKRGNINVTWYRTEWQVGEDTTMDRWQVDYIFRF